MTTLTPVEQAYKDLSDFKKNTCDHDADIIASIIDRLKDKFVSAGLSDDAALSEYLREVEKEANFSSAMIKLKDFEDHPFDEADIAKLAADRIYNQFVAAGVELNAWRQLPAKLQVRLDLAYHGMTDKTYRVPGLKPK